MKFVILDAQGYPTPDFQVKELSIYDGKQMKSWVFKPKFPFSDLSEKRKKTVNYVYYNIHGVHYNTGYVDYNKLNSIIKKELDGVDTVYVKGSNKKDFLLSVYNELKIDSPNVIDIQFSEDLQIPKLDKCMVDCIYHKISKSSCSEKNSYILYDYIVNLLPK